MKKLFQLGLICLVLTLLLVGCSDFESGEIAIVAPELGSVIRDPYDGVSNISAVLVLDSSFETEKTVNFFVTSPSGTQGPWICIVPARTKTRCPGVPLVAPGEYTLTIQTGLMSGKVFESTVIFSWDPYTNLDKKISALGVNNAGWGYFVAYVILGILVAILVYLKTKDWAKIFLSLGILTVLIIPVSFFMPSAGIAFWMSCYLIPAAFIFFATSISMFKNPRPNLVLIRPNGTPIVYRSKSYRTPQKQMVIQTKDINGHLDVSQRKKGE